MQPAHSFMARALDEARRGLGRTSPNPAVGAVVVDAGGALVGVGHHARAGALHAEAAALQQAGARARGATLFTTLEPCDHQGRMPPCTEAILGAGIRRVVVGCRDRNPLVSGKGSARLKAAGVEVVEGAPECLEEECARLNAPFFKFITEGRPYVTLKVASTLDGKLAASDGTSRWITGSVAREQVHQLRDRVDAILIGAGTLRCDDPKLTARPGGREAARQPLRLVLTSGDSSLPKGCAFFSMPGGALVVTGEEAGRGLREAVAEAGAELITLPSQKGRIELGGLLDWLAKREVMHLLVEGGAELIGGFLLSGLADELLLYLAPKILGGGLSWAQLNSGDRERLLSEALAVGTCQPEQVGEDLLLRCRLRP